MSQGRRPQFAFETEPLEFPPQMGFAEKNLGGHRPPLQLGVRDCRELYERP